MEREGLRRDGELRRCGEGARTGVKEEIDVERESRNGFGVKNPCRNTKNTKK